MLRSFIREIRRRDVHRMAAYYVIGAWVVIQVAAQFFPGWGIPDSAIRYVWIACFAGFPIALLFSWRYDVTSAGIRRTATSGDRESRPIGSLDLAIVAGLAIILVVVVAAATRTIGDMAQPGIPDKSVAVLAFDDLSPAGDQEWFADGLTEEILNSLARLPELKVSARNSSFSFKGRNLPVPDIASILGVRFIVEGSVRRMGDDLRISYTLVRAADGFQVYRQNLSRRLSDVFVAQEEIATHIAEALDVVLDDQKRESMFALGTRDVAAYEAYLRGLDATRRWFTDNQLDDILAGTEWFDAAIEADPEFAFAYLMRAHNYFRFIEGLYQPNDFAPSETAESLHARILSDYENAVRHAPDQTVRLIAEFSNAVFSDDFSEVPRLANEFEPDAASIVADGLDIQYILATLLLLGDGQDARAYADARIRRNPLDAVAYNQAFLAALRMGDRDAAAAYLDSADEVAGRAVFTEHNRLMYFVAGREWDQAIELAERPGWGHAVFSEPLLAILYKTVGREADADEIMDDLMARGARGPYFALALRETGHVPEARAMIEAIDAAPASILAGSFMFQELGGTVAFDLDWTPRFAARLAEAGITVEMFDFD